MAGATNFSVLSDDEITALTITEIRRVTADQLSALSNAQLLLLSPSQVGFLSAATLGLLTPSAFARFSAVQLAAFRPVQATQLTAGQMAALTGEQVQACNVGFLSRLPTDALQALENITVAQASGFTWSNIARLNPMQFGILLADNAAAFGACRYRGTTIQQFGSLTATQLNKLTIAKLQFIPAADFTVLSAELAAQIRPILIQSLTADQLNSMSASALCALDRRYLSNKQIASLSELTISGMNNQQFVSMLGDRLGDISMSALSGISLEHLSSLSRGQLADFTVAQLNAMGPSQKEFVLQNYSILEDAARQGADGEISYLDALSILEKAALGGMNQAKFSDLERVANDLNSGNITASTYVTQIFGNVVLGNSANANWTGGNNWITILGDLSASSTENQVSELIGKWFLGTDLPSPGSPEGYYVPYVPQTLPLYGLSGAPELSDVNQGELGDCYFLASIAEIALQEPNVIEDAIHSNGNGTYSVRFYVDGKPDYVTVNEALPQIDWGPKFKDGQNMPYDTGNGALWSSLFEKAFVQLNERQEVLHGGNGKASNSYQAIAGGFDWPLKYLTNRSVYEYFFNPWTSSASEKRQMEILQSDFNGHSAITMSTGSEVPPNSNLVPSHMFAVTGIDAQKGTVDLYNPWGDNSTGLPIHVTIDMATAQSARAIFSVA